MEDRSIKLLTNVEELACIAALVLCASGVVLLIACIPLDSWKAFAVGTVFLVTGMVWVYAVCKEAERRVKLELEVRR